MSGAGSSALQARDRLWPMLLVSAAAHVAFILGATLIHPAPVLDLAQKPITARLVRLGEVRPPEYLPRKEAPPPPAAETQAPAPVEPAPAPAPKAVPTAAAAPRAAPKAAAPGPTERAGKPTGARLKNVLSELRQEIQAGSPEGSPLGDAGDGEMTYAGQVRAALQQNYHLPHTISDRERLFLTGAAVLYVDADGRIVRYEIVQRSGNAAFDEALERAVRETRLPPPPADQREAWRRGQRVDFKISG